MKFISLMAILLSAQALGQTSKTPYSEDLAAKGKPLYQTNCAVCHGEKGEGGKLPTTPAPRNLQTDAFTQGDSLEAIEATIKHGYKANPVMRPFEELKDEQIAQIAHYVKKLQAEAKKK